MSRIMRSGYSSSLNYDDIQFPRESLQNDTCHVVVVKQGLEYSLEVLCDVLLPSLCFKLF